jgi:molybdopterin-containing oxidoreductase family membrane subunit
MYDGLMFFGSFGVFLTLYLLFCKFLPTIAISEVKGVMSSAAHSEHAQAELLGHGHSGHGHSGDHPTGHAHH